MSVTQELDGGHEVTLDRTVDEYGERQFGWWCDPCEEGGFAPSPEERDDEVSVHTRGEREQA